MLERVYKPLRIVQNEVPVGIVDGYNFTFTTTYYYEDVSVCVYLNGLKLRVGSHNDYILQSNNVIIMNRAPLPGDVITVDYHRK